MAGKNSGKVEETEQERALAEVATQRLNDYKTRWMPLITRVGELTREAYEPDSFERESLKGKAVGATRMAFGEAGEKTDAAMANAGIRSSSAKAKLGTAEAGDVEATSAGIGMAKADQAIDEAYVQGLSKIMALGRGQATSAIRGMGDAAGDAAQQAQLDAARTQRRRMGNAQLGGQLAGMALTAGMSSMSAGAAPRPAQGSYNIETNGNWAQDDWR